MGYSFSSFAYEEDFLRFMRVRVACSAFGDGFNIFRYFVLNIQMALVAFDFVGIDMSRMHEVSIIISIESVCFPVTFVAVFFRDFSVSYDGVRVAFVA
jgi:hypothetical protein